MPDRFVSAVVLAAGRSTRFGNQNKLLSEYQGTPLVRHAVEAVTCAQVHEVILVVGFDAAAVVLACAGTMFVPVENLHYDKGLGTSVSLGVAHASPLTDVILLSLADCPGVTANSIQRVVAAVTSQEDIAVSSDGEKQAPPVAFGKAYVPELRQLRGPIGASSIWNRHLDHVQFVPVETLELTDVDTVQDLSRLKEK